MKALILLVVLFGWAAGGNLRAAESRAELLFVINVALKTGNRGYFERCFHLDDSDPTARGQVKAIIDEILRWQAPYVTVTDRDPQAGSAEASKLNGEWLFQVHIHKGPPPSTGYVFPAGRVGADMKILLMRKE